MHEPRISRRFVHIIGIAIAAAVFWSVWSCGSGGTSPRQIPPTQHRVELSWIASTSSVLGYNVYRGVQPSGPYPTKLNSSPLGSASFTDSTVQSGTTYYYVVTAVDVYLQESEYSNEVQAVVPSP